MPVPNVQALAAASGDVAVIPDRYLRPEMEDETAGDAGGNERIPVVDLARLLGGPSRRAEEAARLKSACEDWGFFQVNVCRATCRWHTCRKLIASSF